MLPDWDFGGDEAKRRAFIAWALDELDHLAAVTTTRFIATVPLPHDWLAIASIDLRRSAQPAGQTWPAQDGRRRASGARRRKRPRFVPSHCEAATHPRHLHCTTGSCKSARSSLPADPSGASNLGWANTLLNDCLVSDSASSTLSDRLWVCMSVASQTALTNCAENLAA